MGLFKKLFGGDEGIRGAMYETYHKLKVEYPNLKEHEVLSLVLHHRYRRLPPEITLIVGTLFPRIDDLTEWVVGLENSGLRTMKWPNPIFDRYLASTTTLEERERALDFIEGNASDFVSGEMNECPKCGYERKLTGDEWAPSTECPTCGVIYARVKLASDIVLFIEECLLEDASVPPEDVPNWNKTDEKKFLAEVGSIYVFIVHRDCQSSYPDTYSPILTEFHHQLKKNELGHLINGADYYTQLWNESEKMYQKLGGAHGSNPISRMGLKATERCSLQSIMANVRIGISHGAFTKGLAELFLSYPEAMMKGQDIPKNYVSRTKSQPPQEQSRCEKCGHYGFQYDGYWKEYVCKNCGWTIK